MPRRAWFQRPSDRSPRGPSDSDPAPTGAPVLRIDSAHRAAGPLRAADGARAVASGRAARVATAAPPAPIVDSIAHSPRSATRVAEIDDAAVRAARVDRWLSADAIRRPAPFPPARRAAIPSPFERLTADRLASDPERQVELERLGDLCWSGGTPATRRVLLISLGEPLDIPRILIGVCLVCEHRPTTVLVDADWRWKTLSTLVQHDTRPGLGDVLGGRATIDDVVVTLASNGLLIPAGAAPVDGRFSTASPLSEWRPAGMMLMDGGVWPVPDLAALASFADRFFAVVRIDRSRWGDLHQLRRALESLGRRLDGCIAVGGFE